MKCSCERVQHLKILSAALRKCRALNRCRHYYSTYFCDSMLNTCKRICVPDSSFTLSVFETITGPGVFALGVALRLRPLIPVTPCGMPMLRALPPEAEAAEVPPSV